MTIDLSDQRDHLEGVLRERRLLKRLIAERAIIAIIGGGVSFNVSDLNFRPGEAF